jgi:hypothetical protein
MCIKHKDITGKKVRHDNNILFEHVVWLSEHRYLELEKQFGETRAKHAIMQRLKQYALLVKKEFHFEILGVDLHLDEGRYENGVFKRNVHAHLQFMNYSFEKRYAPIRHMMRKGKDRHGRTNQINPNFERLQDLVHLPFKKIGFSRGISKSITNREHLTKEAFIKSKLKEQEQENSQINKENVNLLKQLHKAKKKNESLAAKIDKKAVILERLEKKINLMKDQLKLLEKAISSKCQKVMKSILITVKKNNSSTHSVRRAARRAR